MFKAVDRRHCRGCHNPEQWNFDGGKLYTFETQDKIFDLLNKPYIQRLSLLGGEPLENINIYYLACLCHKVKRDLPYIKIWLYSGYTWEEIYKKYCLNNEVKYFQVLINNIDILVDGDFQEDKKDISLQFKGSFNQRIIDVPKTLKNKGEIIMFDIDH